MSSNSVSFFARLWMAFVCYFRIVFDAGFAAKVLPAYAGAPAPQAALPPAPAAAPPPERVHASGLFVLSMLQREGRLLDFLLEDLTAASDDAVGAAARVVHEGCRRVLKEYLVLEPVVTEAEGAPITVPADFDARRIRLTGNVAGQPPFHGSVKHHGWVTRAVKLPALPTAADPLVLAPAEVELP
jgi:hypothetical protein